MRLGPIERRLRQILHFDAHRDIPTISKIVRKNTRNPEAFDVLGRGLESHAYDMGNDTVLKIGHTDFSEPRPHPFLQVLDAGTLPETRLDWGLFPRIEDAYDVLRNPRHPQIIPATKTALTSEFVEDTDWFDPLWFMKKHSLGPTNDQAIKIGDLLRQRLGVRSMDLKPLNWGYNPRTGQFNILDMGVHFEPTRPIQHPDPLRWIGEEGYNILRRDPEIHPLLREIARLR